MRSITDNFSTIISVGLFFFVGMVIAIIMTLNTIEADQGFTLAAKEIAAIEARDQSCPLTAAERDDLLATDSIRQYVDVIDVYCDETGKEKVTVKYLGDKNISEQEFRDWLTKNTLTEVVEVYVQND